ncbi:hypothetical protein RM844_08660 [Streptomyces sp. DSM 44915]|uniref:UL36 very large tegument protein n=1 Tax=Streptomyces chisholmiae TaxID=3075540 RepID=A0ABU2JMZ2_9ACTN|nr:hypothetical protein [Streptomyces sp. DSM 44915]MDT0266365.1 hypothetical protein [Streptomyces sp. DSM 44915]
MPDVRMMEREWSDRLAAFTSELRALAEVLDPSAGWFAAFHRRNGAELAAWLAGRTLPPWDAVADLAQDLAVLRGEGPARTAAGRLRAGYEAATAARDALPGGRAALTGLLADLDRAADELAARLRMLTHAADSARRAGQPAEADRLAGLAEWTRDDQERVLTRRAEAHARLAAVGTRPGEPPIGGPKPTGPEAVPPRPDHAGAGPRVPTAARQAAARPARATAGPQRAAATDADPDAAGAAPARRRAKPARRPRGARFAGLDPVDEATATGAAGETNAAVAPSPAPASGGTAPDGHPPATGEAGPPPPSGSRFAGALRDHRPSLADRVTDHDLATATRTADQLRDLRALGENGAAHGLLCAAVGGPPVRIPLLLAELERAGMDAEMTTLLWEAASLPPAPLAAAAEALTVAGRAADCGQLLRQGAARPAAEVGSVAAALRAHGLGDRAVALLRALVQARTAEEAAQAARPAPRVLVPMLLAAAQEVSPRHHRAVSSELRRAGVA